MTDEIRVKSNVGVQERVDGVRMEKVISRKPDWVYE